MKKSLFTLIVLSLCSLLAAQFIVWRNGQIVYQSNINEVDSITLYEYKLPDAPDKPNDPKYIVVKAKVPSSWDNDITAWVWATEDEGREVRAIRDGDWWVVTAHCAELNVIFKNGWGWNGEVNQTEEITGIRENTCYQLKQMGAQKATATAVDCPNVNYNLEIEEDSISLLLGETYKISYTLTPEYANEIFDIEFISSNENVATISSEGVITAIAKGETIINVAIKGTNIKASCLVVVKTMLDVNFNNVILLNIGDSYQINYTTKEGIDTSIAVVDAQLLVLPSTMYVDGDGYLAGKPGYTLNIKTIIPVVLNNYGYIKSIHPVGDYSFVDNALNENGQFRPYTIQIGHFNQNLYQEYYTNAILYSKGAIEEEPIIDNYPYFNTNDSYMYKSFYVEYGFALAESGYPTIAEGRTETSIMQIRIDKENRLYPSYYDFDAVLFGDGDQNGFALEEKIDEETGDTNYSYEDKDNDGLFDMAPFVNHTFTYGTYDNATEGVSIAEKIAASKPIPAAPMLKKAHIIRALNIPFFMKANIK